MGWISRVDKLAKRPKGDGVTINQSRPRRTEVRCPVNDLRCPVNGLRCPVNDLHQNRHCSCGQQKAGNLSAAAGAKNGTNSTRDVR